MLDGEPNFATPIDVVQHADRTVAWIDNSEMLRRLGVPLTQTFLRNALKGLPRTLAEFSSDVKNLRAATFDASFGDILKKNPGEFVITGRDAARICDFVNGESCRCPGPQPAGLTPFYAPQLREDIDLELRNGNLERLPLGGTIAIRSKATSAENRAIEIDERLHQQIALSGMRDLELATFLRLRSATAAEAPADALVDAAEVTDKHGRKWIRRTWTLQGEDYVVVSLARSLSQGSVVLMNAVPTAGGKGAALQLAIAANLAYACPSE
jgi:hypothetical protein